MQSHFQLFLVFVWQFGWHFVCFVVVIGHNHWKKWMMIKFRSLVKHQLNSVAKRNHFSMHFTQHNHIFNCFGWLFDNVNEILWVSLWWLVTTTKKTVNDLQVQTHWATAGTPRKWPVLALQFRGSASWHSLVPHFGYDMPASSIEVFGYLTWTIVNYFIKSEYLLEAFVGASLSFLWILVCAVSVVCP